MQGGFGEESTGAACREVLENPIQTQIVTDSTLEPRIVAVANGWHMVEVGRQQVSLGPDGLIQLPRHLPPNEAAEFCAAMRAAAELRTRIEAGEVTPTPAGKGAAPKHKAAIGRRATPKKKLQPTEPPPRFTTHG